MNKPSLNQSIELVAAIAVVLGLVLVAYELRQNSELMRIQVSQARADTAMASLEYEIVSDHIPKILVKVKNGSDLTEEEWIRYVAWFRAVNRNQDNVLGQWEAGMLGDNTPRSVAGFACAAVASAKYSVRAWENTKHGYTDAYIRFVEAAIEKCE